VPARRPPAREPPGRPSKRADGEAGRHRRACARGWQVVPGRRRGAAQTGPRVDADNCVARAPDQKPGPGTHRRLSCATTRTPRRPRNSRSAMQAHPNAHRTFHRPRRLLGVDAVRACQDSAIQKQGWHPPRKRFPGRHAPRASRAQAAPARRKRPERQRSSAHAAGASAPHLSQSAWTTWEATRSAPARVGQLRSQGWHPCRPAPQALPRAPRARSPPAASARNPAQQRVRRGSQCMQTNRSPEVRLPRPAPGDAAPTPKQRRRAAGTPRSACRTFHEPRWPPEADTERAPDRVVVGATQTSEVAPALHRCAKASLGATSRARTAQESREPALQRARRGSNSAHAPTARRKCACRLPRAV
jgi:hypothetical protein